MGRQLTHLAPPSSPVGQPFVKAPCRRELDKRDRVANVKGVSALATMRSRNSLHGGSVKEVSFFARRLGQWFLLFSASSGISTVMTCVQAIKSCALCCAPPIAVVVLVVLS